MKKSLAVAAIGLSGLTAIPAQAMQIAPVSVSAGYVTLVAGGCGIGFHRGLYGGCRPNGYGYGVVGVPAYGYGYHGGYGYGYHGGYRYGGAYRYGGGGGYHYGPHGGYHYHY
jgi:hypothetical protein